MKKKPEKEIPKPTRRIVCSCCRKGIMINYETYTASAQLASEEKDALTVVRGDCPFCGAALVIYFDDEKKAEVLSCEHPGLPEAEKVDDFDRKHGTKTLLRMKCSWCGRHFDVGICKYSRDTGWNYLLEIIRSDVSVTNSLRWIESYSASSRFQSEKDFFTARDGGVEIYFSMIGPCPCCKKTYKVNIRYEVSFLKHELISMYEYTRLSRNESLALICEHAGGCERSLLCELCFFNNGKNESVYHFCTYWGDTRIIDLARHDVLGEMERYIAAEKELKRSRG